MRRDLTHAGLVGASAAVAVLVVAPRAATRLGHYASTSCLHRQHNICRQTCKYCDAPCRCWCHLRERLRLRWIEWRYAWGIGV